MALGSRPNGGIVRTVEPEKLPRYCVPSIWVADKTRNARTRKNSLFYTDVYGPDLLLLMLLILSLCVTDAGLTILILQKGGVELNPFMVWLLESSSHTFFTAKYVLTAACLTVVLLHINFKLFNRVAMQHVLMAVLGGYTLLVGYELKILAI